MLTDLDRNLSSNWQIDLTSSGVTLDPDFQSPTISGGKLYFDLNGISWTKGGSVTFTLLGTPEPATWAMVVMGFGAVGAAMRRRTRVAARIALNPA